MNINKIVMVFVIVFSALCFTQSTFAGEKVNYLYFFIDENSQDLNKVSYEVDLESIISENEELVVELNINGEVHEICRKPLENKDNVAFMKVTCEVPKEYGDGEYTFKAKIIDKENTLEEITNKEFMFENVKASMSFENFEGKTVVVIDVTGEGKNIIVKQEIPKSVIEVLNESNKNDLIETDFNYKILNEDPLIAWNIEKAPTKINYTINKDVSDQQTEEFGMQVESNQNLGLFKFVIVILIFVILGFAFKPLYSKKR